MNFYLRLYSFPAGTKGERIPLLEDARHFKEPLGRKATVCKGCRALTLMEGNVETAKKRNIAASGISANLQKAIDHEWVATERSDDAENALLREYYYHLLRVEELRRFLHGCGFALDSE